MLQGIGACSGAGFKGLVRIAGWNDTDPGVQIIVGHAGGAWRFESSEGDNLQIPEFVGRDLVRLFQWAAQGERVAFSSAWPLPADRTWLVEGFGQSEVFRSGEVTEAQRHIIEVTSLIYTVHQLLLGGLFDPYRSVEALVAQRDSGPKLVLRARWSNVGFVFRWDEFATAYPDDLVVWPIAGTCSDPGELVPTVAGMWPVRVHPVVAWGLAAPIDTLVGSDDPVAEERHAAWVSAFAQAIRSCTEARPLRDAATEAPAAAADAAGDDTVGRPVADEPSASPVVYTSYLASYVAKGPDAYIARLAVADAAETRYYTLSARTESGGWSYEFDGPGSSAMEAMSKGAPADGWGKRYLMPAKFRARALRRFVTGHILEEWLGGRLGRSAICDVLSTTAEDIANYRRASAASDDDDDRGWDDWEVLGGRQD